MIDFLRLQIHIQDKDGTVTQSEDYLALTDEQLTLFLNVARSKSYPDYSLFDFPESGVYGLMLLAKRELFTTLAAKVAPDYDMTADNNNVLREHQMFTAYWKLIQLVDAQYAQYLETSDGAGFGTVSTFDALVNTRYYTRRNYDKGVAPSLSIRLHGVYNDRVEVSWVPRDTNRFLSYEVRVGINPTWDRAAQGRDDIFDPKARFVANIRDAHITMCRVTGLAPDTNYYLSVMVRERNGLFGVREINFTTERV